MAFSYLLHRLSIVYGNVRLSTKTNSPDLHFEIIKRSTPGFGYRLGFLALLLQTLLGLFGLMIYESITVATSLLGLAVLLYSLFGSSLCFIYSTSKGPFVSCPRKARMTPTLTISSCVHLLSSQPRFHKAPDFALHPIMAFVAFACPIVASAPASRRISCYRGLTLTA